MSDEANAATVMTDPGEQLRLAREQKGISLKAISDKTLIPVSRLQALEAQDFDRMGGLAYVTGYARAYTRFLGLKSEPYIQGFEALFGVEKQNVQPVEFDLSPELSKKKPFRKLLVLTALIAVLVFAATQILPFRSGSVLPVQTEPRENTEESVTNEAAEPQSEYIAPKPTIPNLKKLEQFREAAQALPESLDEKPIDEEPLDETPPADKVDNPASDVDSVELTASEQAGEEPQSNEVQKDLLVMNFTDDCWVEVTDSAGLVKIAQIAESGDNLQLFGVAPFQVMLGNARAAFVALNGEVVSIPIRSGRRTARFSVGESDIEF